MFILEEDKKGVEGGVLEDAYWILSRVVVCAIEIYNFVCDEC